MTSSAHRRNRIPRVVLQFATLVFVAGIAFAPVAWERLPWAGLVIVSSGDGGGGGGGDTADPGVDETKYSDVGVIAPENPYPPSEGSSFRYLDYFGDRAPVVSTCEPFPFTIRSNVGPKGGVEMVFEGMQELANVTGISFVFEGFTDKVYDFNEPSAVWPWNADDRHLWIGWASQSEVPDLGPKNEIGSYHVGLGGPSGIEGPDGTEIIRAAVVLRSDFDAEVGFGQGDKWGNVLLHELGHAFGLDHVDDDAQLMYFQMVAEQPGGWRDGDLAGLQGVNERCAG